MNNKRAKVKILFDLSEPSETISTPTTASAAALTLSTTSTPPLNVTTQTIQTVQAIETVQAVDTAENVKIDEITKTKPRQPAIQIFFPSEDLRDLRDLSVTPFLLLGEGPTKRVIDKPKNTLKITFEPELELEPEPEETVDTQKNNRTDKKKEKKERKDKKKDQDKKTDKKDKKEKKERKDKVSDKPETQEYAIDSQKWSWVSMSSTLSTPSTFSPSSSELSTTYSPTYAPTLPSYATSSPTNTNKNPLLLEGEQEQDDGVIREIVYPVTNGIMLAEEYRKGTGRIPQVDPTGWWASEKYDGIRVLWDGISLWTRAMHQINAPIWFQSRLPPSFSLDGELFIKRDHFNETSGIIRNKIPNPDDWAPMMFMVFDIPHLGYTHPFEKRLEILKEIVNRYGEPLSYINHIKIKSATHLDSIHQNLMLKGAEGTMIRAPNSFYEATRSRTLLKVKDQYDAECIVEGWEEGKNRNTGRLGALEVTWEDPVGVWEKYGNEYDTPYYGIFKAGSGLSDIDRVLMKDVSKAFPRGSRVRVAFSQLQKSGKPKHPAYKGRVH